jgi:hypothetical protein
MRRAIVLFMLGGLLAVLACPACGPDQSQTGCSDPGGTCVTPGPGVACQETLPYACPQQGAVCCIVEATTHSGSSSGK